MRPLLPPSTLTIKIVGPAFRVSTKCIYTSMPPPYTHKQHDTHNTHIIVSAPSGR